MSWEEVKRLLHLTAKFEDQEHRFLAQLQGIDLPQQVFDEEELGELTPGQMQQRTAAMAKAKALQERMRAQKYGSG